MIYEFICEKCGSVRPIDSKPFDPPPPPEHCGQFMRRIYGCQIDTSGCRDHSDIPEGSRVQRYNAPTDPAREEARFQRHIQDRRKELRDGNKGSIRHTHSVPADLYHGKIRETGDRNYWNDPKNVDKHKDCRVDQ